MPKKIIVACGGTGGHAFPGLAAARALRAKGHEVAIWSSGRAIESNVLRDWDGATFTTGARQLTLGGIFANLRSVLKCCREMRRVRPDAVLAMGSYASLPPVLAATLMRIPVILHEANVVPGRAVDVLSRFAKVVALTFPSTANWLEGCTTEVTGLPVRAEVAGQKRFEDVPEDAFTVFVTGGSQGAHRVNELLTNALVRVKTELDKTGERKLYIIHQTGINDEGNVTGIYTAAGIPARVQAFEREMGRAFATANVVVARAGASTCFELALAGCPAFFLPLPTALRNHQHLNAEWFTAARAADEGNQEIITPRAIANWILERIRRPELLQEQAKNMKALAVPDAADKLAALVERMAK